MDNVYYFVDLMPRKIKNILLSLEKEQLLSITEIRIRRRKPLIIYVGNKLFFISSINNKLLERYTSSCVTVDDESFNIIIDRLCNNSYHTNMSSMVKGYITTKNGSRIGIAASAVYSGRDISVINDIASVNIRISHELKGISNEVLDLIYDNNNPNIIISGAPASGKTTLLRDIARALSSGYNGEYKRTVIIDERGEISSGFDTGINTDILLNYSKQDGVEIAVRTLSPEIIICDEVGSEAEAECIKAGFFSGASFILSVHLSSIDDIENSIILKKLISYNQFDYLVHLISYTDEYEIINLRKKDNENCRRIIDSMLNNNDFISDYKI